MATSGTVSQTTFDTRKVIEHAFRRCRLRAEQLTAEHAQIALDALYLQLSALVNRGMQLWCIERLIVPLYQGQAAYTMSDGTVDLTNTNIRSLSRLEGTYTSSASGTVASGFDDDFSTKCTQTSSGGNIKVQFDDDTSVTSVGILPGTSATWTLTFERSDDDVTWTTALATASYAYVDSEWKWYDIDGAQEAEYFRVRVNAAGTLSVREIFLGNTPAEIPIARLNQDDWTAFPNKAFEGRPLQFWLDRQRNAPIMRTWPVCDLNSRYQQFIVWRRRQLEDIGTMAQVLDIPQRWYEAVVWGLATRLAQEVPEIDAAIIPMLESNALNSADLAQSEERDNSPMFLSPTIGVYTA